MPQKPITAAASAAAGTAAADPKLAPLDLLASLDREALEKQEAELQGQLDAIRVLLKAARIRDGIELPKKPGPSPGNRRPLSVMGRAPRDAASAAESTESAEHGDRPDFRGVSAKILACLKHGGKQRIEAIANQTGLEARVVRAYIAQTDRITCDEQGYYRIAS